MGKIMQHEASILFVDKKKKNLSDFKFEYGTFYNIFTAQSDKEASKYLQRNRIDLVIANQEIEGNTGVAFLGNVSRDYPDVMRIIITEDDVDVIINAINIARVFRHFATPWDEIELKVAIDNALEVRSLQLKNRLLVDELKLSEEKFRSTFEQASVGIAHIDLDLNIVMVNQRFCDIHGYTKDEMLSLSLSALTRKEDIEECHYYFEKLKSGALQQYTKEKRFIRKDKTLVWGSFKATPKINEQGKPDYFIVIVEDITKEKEAEEALRKSEKSFRRFIEAAPDSVVIFNEEHEILLINKQTEELFGYKPEEIIGQPFEMLIPRRSVSMGTVRDTVIRSDPHVYDVSGFIQEYYGYHKNGKEFPVEVSLNPLEIEDEIIISAAIRDITDRKLAEVSLRKSERSLAEAQRIAHIGSWNWNIGDKEWSCSEEMFRILGFVPDELKLTLELFLDMAHPEDRPEVQKAIKESIAQKKTYSIDHRILLADKQEKIVHEQIEVVWDDAGNAVELHGTMQDITKRKKIEEALRDSEDRYRSLFEDSPISLWEEDFSEVKHYIDYLKGQGVEDFRDYFEEHPEALFECVRLVKIENVNQASLDLFKAQDKEEIILGLERMYTKDSLKAFQDELLSFIDGIYHYDNEIVQQTLHGERIWSVRKSSMAPGYENNWAKVFISVIDITTRKIFEAILRKNEANLITLIENTPDSIWSIDADYNIIIINSSMKQYYEDAYNIDLDIGSNMIELLPEALRVNWKKYFDRALKGEQFSFEEIYSVDTLPHISEISMTPIRIESGKIVGVSCFSRDITERKKAEKEIKQLNEQLELRVQQRTQQLEETLQALLEKEEQYRTIFNNVMDAVLIFNDKGKIVEVNPKACEQYGYSYDEITHLSISDLIHADYQHVIHSFQSDLSQGNLYHVASKDVRKDHSLLDTEISATYIMYKEKPHVLAISRDVTQRKRVEEALRESEEKYRELTELLPQTVYEMDLNGNFTYLNKYAELSTGYTKDDLKMNLNVFQMIPVEEHASLRENIERTFNGMQEKPNEYTVILKDGRSIPMLIYSAPVIHNNKPVGLRGIGIDISGLKQVEEELRIAHEVAEAANKAKGVFLATMSHEIRTPMNAIIGMNHLLRKTSLTAKQQDYVDKIQSASKNLLSIINDVLDFSKIEAGKIEIESINFNLQEVFDNLANLLYIKTQEKRLELIFIIEHDVPLSLAGDPLRLGQVLLNLTNNAVKFTNKGEIIVEVKRVKSIDSWVQLQFSVIDSGIGLSEEQMTQLFQSFIQGDSSTTRKYGGTGLGLSISKALVELMGGDIHVKSRLGVGSTFYFTLPFEYNRDGMQLGVVLQEIPSELSIMIIDDNSKVREVFENYMKQYAKQIRSVASGHEALAILRDENAEEGKGFDLVLVDWDMPEISGMETIRAIQHDVAIRRQPKIVLITGYSCEDLLSRTEDMSLNGFLIKPVSPLALYSIIMDLYGKTSSRETIKKVTPKEVTYHIEDVKGARILLVEDNEINQQVALELLESEGFFVTVAENGFEAIKKVSSGAQDYDLILMDLQMPEMDGYEATMKIRQDVSLRKIPIVAMTADAMDGIQEKVMQAGMNDYITKPIDTHEFFKLIAKWVKPNTLKTVEHKRKESKKKTKHSLPEIKEVNVKEGIQRTAGNHALYFKLLIKFSLNNKHMMEKIRNCLDEYDYERAQFLAHSLKGDSGTIGATNVFKAARELDDLLKREPKDREHITQAFQEATRHMETVLKSIEDFSETYEEAKKTVEAEHEECQQHTLLEMMQQLREYLDHYDAQAVRYFQNIHSSLKSEITDEVMSSLEVAMETYNFTRAQEICTAIHDTIIVKDQLQSNN